MKRYVKNTISSDIRLPMSIESILINQYDYVKIKESWDECTLQSVLYTCYERRKDEH